MIITMIKNDDNDNDDGNCDDDFDDCDNWDNCDNCDDDDDNGHVITVKSVLSSIEIRNCLSVNQYSNISKHSFFLKRRA